MKKLLALATLSVVTTLFANQSEFEIDKHYLNEDQIELRNGQIRFNFPDGEQYIFNELHSDEFGIFITDFDIKQINLIEKKHRDGSTGNLDRGYNSRDCNVCGDTFSNRWSEQRHRDDFQCERGPQGCARR